MKMEIKYLDATLDEAQALIDAERNAGIVEAVSEALLATGDAQGFLEAVIEILGEGGG